jgi:hypothetical protein
VPPLPTEEPAAAPAKVTPAKVADKKEAPTSIGKKGPPPVRSFLVVTLLCCTDTCAFRRAFVCSSKPAVPATFQCRHHRLPRRHHHH